ncbi:MAG: hypothetical protein U1F46_08215 [Marinagarivorans sp.]
MEIAESINDFASWIGEIARCKVEETDDSFIYKFKSAMSEGLQLSLSKDKLRNEITLLREFESTAETVITTDRSYEILVREEGPYFRFSPRSRDENVILEIEDSENKIKYTLGRPSNQFILFLIKNAVAHGDPRALCRPLMNASTMRRTIEEQPCVFDYLKKFIAGRMTLKVKSDTRKSPSDFDKFSSAFLFNITYNTDTALVQQRDFDELMRTSRITRNRRSNIDEIDPPRRTYVPDLIHHYQLAVGTENPMLEYICYYHIAEHFFESVFNEDLVDKVRNKLTHPDFSYKRKKDISALIKEIGKSIKMRDDSMTFNEQEGLRLTLKKYLNINELVQKLNDYDKSLIDYYKLEPVVFSGAGTVHLEGDDEELTFKHLAARIYKNRNSIVHSKEWEKEKYTPFRDDKTLVKEVPLLRFISEKIIFETSTVV